MIIKSSNLRKNLKELRLRYSVNQYLSYNFESLESLFLDALIPTKDFPCLAKSLKNLYLHSLNISDFNYNIFKQLSNLEQLRIREFDISCKNNTYLRDFFITNKSLSSLEIEFQPSSYHASKFIMESIIELNLTSLSLYNLYIKSLDFIKLMKKTLKKFIFQSMIQY